MNRFAELLDRLAYEPGRNNKLRLLTAYFREVEDPDRGYALAALMWPKGAINRKESLLGHPPPQPSPARGEGAQRNPERAPRSKSKPASATLSQDSAASALSVPSPLAGEGQGGGYRGHNDHDAQRPQNLHNNPPPPTLTEVVTMLRTLGKTELPKQLTRWLDELDETGRWALLKIG